MRPILTLIFIMSTGLTAFSQQVQEPEIMDSVQTYSYAYISVQGKAFSKKLKVEVDFGDSPDQLKSGKEYSDILTNKKSYAAVLNYMADRQFDLVETRDISYSFQGTGENTGIILIMRKLKK